MTKTERKIVTGSDSGEDRERKIVTVTAVKTERERGKIVTDSDSSEDRQEDSHRQ